MRFSGTMPKADSDAKLFSLLPTHNMTPVETVA